MKPIFQTLSLALITLALATSSCTDSDFTIKGQIDNAPDKFVTIAYTGDNGNITQRVMITEGNQFNFKGTSKQYTLLWIWDANNQLIAQMVVKDGDDMTVKSDGLRVPTTDVKGNDITQQWMKFRKDNNNIFDASDYQAIDRLIEQQIAQHPEQLLSTVLLVAEYSQLHNIDKVKKLLQTIQPEAKPQPITATIDYLIQHNKATQGIINNITLYKHNKGFEDLNVMGKPTAILFWSRSDKNRKAAIDTLNNITHAYDDNINIADILVDTDTAQWARNIATNALTATHWWAPGGIMDPMLKNINIQHTPMILVTDSTAHVKIIKHL